MSFDISLGENRPPARPTADTPFRILVLGDLDARSSRGLVQPLADRRPVHVDVDNYEAVLERLGADVQLGLPGAEDAPIHLKARGIDDLHPDRLLKSMEQFAALRKTRELLLDPATFALAAAEVRTWCAPSSAAGPSDTGSVAPPTQSPTGRESDADTIERLLGRAPAPATTAGSTAADLIRRVVAPHVVAAPAADQPALVAAVEEAMADLMRAVLHDSGFRALESTWRGIDFLLRRVESGDSLRVSVLNLSRSELTADLLDRDDLRQSALFRILVESAVQSSAAAPWALVLGLYPFGSKPADLEVLGRLAKIARAAGAPFVASAEESLWQLALESPPPDDPGVEGWTALRQSAGAEYLGLTCPRVLLRLPYGRATDPVSTFAFEEFAGRPEPAGYLWGHPALALGALLGEQFVESGWEMSPGAGMELGELPVHTWKEGAESCATPCAEQWIPDAHVERLLNFGLMPWQSIPGRDAIRLSRVQSIRRPLTGLAGRWQADASG